MKFDLTIAIVTYHNYKDVENAVESINKYTDKNLKKKIYIIDNADEYKYYEHLTKLYSDVEYVNTGGNLGFGKGHNYILSEVNSDFHAIVNPDTWITEDTFTKLIHFMEDKTIGMTAPKLLDENEEIQKVYRRDITITDILVRFFFSKLFKKRFDYHTMQEYDFKKPFKVSFIQGSFLLIRTSIFKELGGFDPMYFMYLEDADLCKRINDISQLVYCPNAVAYHKWEKGSHKNKKLLKYHIQSMILYFNKWGYKLI